MPADLHRQVCRHLYHGDIEVKGMISLD